MVGDYRRAGYFLKTVFRHQIHFLILTISLFIFITGCNSMLDTKNKTLLTESNIPFNKWDEVFTEDEIIPFIFPDVESEIFSVNSMAISTGGDYFIVDGRAGRIIHFNKKGQFVSYIGRKGAGPGEYFIAGCLYLDDNDNLYIFDIGKMRLNKYSPPNYKFSGQINIGQPIQDFFQTNENNFIIYATTGEHVLYMLKNTGETLSKTFKPKNERLRLFMARFQLGRITAIPNNRFLLIYPEEYKIYLFNKDLKLERILHTQSNSKFFPTIDKFPKTLSPYSYTPKHAKWWGQNPHPAFIYYLGDQYFAVVLIEYNNLSAKLFINIHDLNGMTLAKGIQIPYNGVVRYAEKGLIYVVEESRFTENGEITPIKLHRYKFKLIKD